MSRGEFFGTSTGSSGIIRLKRQRDGPETKSRRPFAKSSPTDWRGSQAELHETPEAEAGPFDEQHDEQLGRVFGFERVEKLLCSGRVPGRPAKDRVALT